MAASPDANLMRSRYTQLFYVRRFDDLNSLENSLGYVLIIKIANIRQTYWLIFFDIPLFYDIENITNIINKIRLLR